jgi:DNA-binding transcriptional MerR regulator/methylmalonyl-CoA mutase cobalamin-binding subunit
MGGNNDVTLAVMGIAAIERDTGLSKDTLRVWERRYGFPNPLRDAHGERLYTAEDLTRLRLIKRLMNKGLRPGKIIPLEVAALHTLLADNKAATETGSAAGDALIHLLKSHRITELRRHLKNLLIRQGLERFVMDTVVEMNTQVGDAWMRGQLAIFEEHLYSEQLQVLLRIAISQLDVPRKAPRILLTTLPGEQHTIGLLMVEAILTLEGATCLALGPQTPVPDIQLAIRAHKADVLCLSCSAAFPKTQCLNSLADLRHGLDAGVAVWVGGAGVPRGGLTEGVRRLDSLTGLVAAVSQWRNGITLD